LDSKEAENPTSDTPPRQTYDPRSKIMKQICEQVLESTGVV
jgi:citrate synthase